MNSPPFACLFTGNPALANGATAIAISVLTQNVDCFKQWDVLYKENLEASVALLNELVDEWKDHSLKLSSSSSDTLTVKHAMNSFRMKVIIMPLLEYSKLLLTNIISDLTCYNIIIICL